MAASYNRIHDSALHCFSLLNTFSMTHILYSYNALSEYFLIMARRGTTLLAVTVQILERINIKVLLFQDEPTRFKDQL